MSLKIIKCEPRLARILLITAAILCVAAGWYFIKWNFANVVASRLDIKRAELKPIADWLTQIAPNDPQTHFSAARIFERTFDAGDLSRALREYEITTTLSPYNFIAWIDLGKARGLNGDEQGSLAAYKRASELAPNYASVQWAYGNALVRQGETASGFPLIAKAAASNSDYAQPAVLTALQVFNADLEQVRQGLGDTDVTNAALAAVLSDQGHFDEAFNAWSKLSDVNNQKTKQLGETLIEKFAAAKRFQLATRVASALRTSEAEKPVIGQITNGGFENGVKLRNAGSLEWQIAEGSQPEVGLSEGQTHGGKYCLLIMFHSFETAAFRSISQTTAVAPGAEYEFEVYYRSDVKTSASLKWEIADAMTTVAIASTPPMASTADWTLLNVRFRVPADSDGIIIRLAREGCSGPSCPVNGNLWVDDISLRRL
ncbi:MAG: carbohydrate binding domain-containing protein [Pyrinomonadaceae bacterium]